MRTEGLRLRLRWKIWKYWLWFRMILVFSIWPFWRDFCVNFFTKMQVFFDFYVTNVCDVIAASSTENFQLLSWINWEKNWRNLFSFENRRSLRDRFCLQSQVFVNNQPNFDQICHFGFFKNVKNCNSLHNFELFRNVLKPQKCRVT